MTVKDAQQRELEENCRCSGPNAKPPCNYRTGNMSKDWYETRYQGILEKYLELCDDYAKLEKAPIADFAKEEYQESYEEARAYGVSEAYADLRKELRDDVYKKEYGKIREEVEAEARADIYAQAREDILREIAEANERI